MKKDKKTGDFINWKVNKEDNSIMVDYYPNDKTDLKKKEIKFTLTDKDVLNFSIIKKISELNENDIKELKIIEILEEALHYFTHYVRSIEFIPQGKSNKFRYQLEVNIKRTINSFEDVEDREELIGEDNIRKKIKEIIESSVVNNLIEAYIIKPAKSFKLKLNKTRDTKFGLHFINQLYHTNTNKQLRAFSDEILEEYQNSTGVVLNNNNKPDSYGVVLNQIQSRVLEAILKALSDTNYSGDVAINKDTYSRTEMRSINKIKAYNNIDKIPVIKITQAELLELSGLNRSHGDKTDLIEAINFLGSQQFCFYWKRLKYENGKPVKDKSSGEYIKEDVMEVGTVLRIKYVKKEKSGDLDYYEIHPSAVLLDQIESYFLLIPNNWREEVKQITGKKASKYTYEFLTWLRLQYEQIRRYNNNGGKNRKPKEFKLSKSWEEIAIALKMPESIYKANRKRAERIIKEAYEVAIKLGYLLRVEDAGATDLLYLNESYYPKPGKLN